MAASPIKGLERLSEELRLERQKSQQALQERARSKIEIETLRQSNEQVRNEFLDLQNKYEELQNQSRSYSNEIEKLQSDEYLYTQRIEDLEQQLQEQRLQYEQFVAEQMQLKLTYQQQHEEALTSQMKIDTLEKKSLVKDDLINSLKQEIGKMRHSHLNFEQEKLSTLQELNNTSMINEELQLKLQSVDNLEDCYHSMEDRYMALKDELEDSLQLNSQLNSTVHELTNKLLDKQQSEKTLSVQMETIQQEKQQLIDDIEQLESQYHEILQHIQLEKEAHEAMRERANAAVRNRTFLDEQVIEIKTLYEETLQKNNDYESTINDLQLTILKLSEKLQELSNQIDEKDHQLQKHSHQTTYQQEISQLKIQLTVMKKQLLQQQLQQENQFDGNGGYTSQSILQREQQGKQVYDTIIQDLRHEQQQINSKYEELLGKHNIMMMKAQRVDQLEEEIIMYKEMAKHITLEKQTVEITSSEISERNLKTIHENHHLLTNLHRIEKELQCSQQECYHLQEDMNLLREKNKIFHQSHLSAEKKSTELLTLNAKLQGSLEDMKQQYDILQLDYEKLTRQLHEQSNVVNNHHTLQQELSQQKELYEQLSNNYNQQTLQLTDIQHIQVKEQEMFVYQKTILTQEIDNYKQKILTKDTTIHELHQEITKLHHEYHLQIITQEKLIKQLQNDDTMKTEEQLYSLKIDLQQTLSDYQEMEQEKSLKSTIITNIQLELTKEKEYNSQLVYQLQQQEEKMLKLSEELNSYRTVDIYHHTKQVELASYRQQQHQSQHHQQQQAQSKQYTISPPLPPPSTSSSTGVATATGGGLPPLPMEEYFDDENDNETDENQTNDHNDDDNDDDVMYGEERQTTATSHNNHNNNTNHNHNTNNNTNHHNHNNHGETNASKSHNTKLSLNDIVSTNNNNNTNSNNNNNNTRDFQDNTNKTYSNSNQGNRNSSSSSVYRPLFTPQVPTTTTNTSNNTNNTAIYGLGLSSSTSNRNKSAATAPTTTTNTANANATTTNRYLRSPTSDYSNRLANFQKTQDYATNPNKVMLSQMMKPYSTSASSSSTGTTTTTTVNTATTYGRPLVNSPSIRRNHAPSPSSSVNNHNTSTNNNTNNNNNNLHNNNNNNSASSNTILRNRTQLAPELIRAEEEEEEVEEGRGEDWNGLQEDEATVLSMTSHNTNNNSNNNSNTIPRSFSFTLQDLQASRKATNATNSNNSNNSNNSVSSNSNNNRPKNSSTASTKPNATAFEYRGDMVNRALKEQEVERNLLQQQEEEDPAYQRALRRAARDKLLLERVLLEDKMKGVASMTTPLAGSRLNLSTLSNSSRDLETTASRSSIGMGKFTPTNNNTTTAARTTVGYKDNRRMDNYAPTIPTPTTTTTTNTSNMSRMQNTPSFSSLRAAEQQLMKKTGVDLEKAKRLLSM